MSPRERILTTLRHKEPDKVPVDLGSAIVTGIMGIAYNQLKKYLGIKEGEIRVFDVVQQLAEVEELVLKRIEATVLPIYPGYPDGWKEGKLTDGTLCKVPRNFYPEILPDGSQIVREKGGYFGDNEEGLPTLKMPPGGFYFDFPYHPLQRAKKEEDIDNFNWGWKLEKKDLEDLRSRAKYLYENTEYALMGGGLWGGWGQIYEVLENLRGWDTFLMDLVTDQKFAEYMLDKRLEVVMRRFEQYLEVMGDYVQIITVGDDLGTQDGPQLSLELYRKVVKPRQKKLYQFIKERTDIFLFLHTCGSVYEFIPDFIEMGVDILNPVQVSAKNMDTKKLKKEFGKDIVFWGGGCDTQKVLPFGTPDDVREEVKRRIDDFAPGGGFVFCPVHNIQLNMPPENIMAMYETVMEYGVY